MIVISYSSLDTCCIGHADLVGLMGNTPWLGEACEEGALHHQAEATSSKHAVNA